MAKKADIVKEFLGQYEPGEFLTFSYKTYLYHWDHHRGEIEWVRFLAKKHYEDKTVTKHQYDSWHYPEKEVLANF